jgi:hypothetical protein
MAFVQSRVRSFTTEDFKQLAHFMLLLKVARTCPDVLIFLDNSSSKMAAAGLTCGVFKGSVANLRVSLGGPADALSAGRDLNRFP